MEIRTVLKSKFVRLLLFILLSIVYFEVNAQEQAIISAKLDSLLIRVDEDIKEENFKEVTLVIDSLKQTSVYKKNRFDRLAIDLRYGQLLYQTKRDEKVITLLLRGITELKDNSNSKLLWRYNKELALLFFRHDNYERAHYYADKNVANSVQRGDLIDMMESEFMKGLIFSNEFLDNSNSGKYLQETEKTKLESKSLSDSALFYYNKVVEKPQNSSSFQKIARAYSGKGSIFLALDDLTSAERNLEESLRIIIEFEDEYHPNVYLPYANLGGVLYKQKKYNQAIKKYFRAYRSIENKFGEKLLAAKADILQNISWCYEELEEYKLAYEWQVKTSDLNDSLELKKMRSISAIEAKYLESQKVEVEKNKRLQTQLYFLGFVLLTLIITIIGYVIYNRLLNKQRRTERKISGLKYKALNAQMNPHFINNLLLCIHDLVDTSEKDTAIENLDKFNKLTNLVLRSTKSNLIALSKEVEMLELYLDLQLVRFDKKFEYEIHKNRHSVEKFKSIKIPPLILQPLVENSILHGFRNMKEKGKLLIDFKIENEDYLSCIITDNGKETPKYLEPEMYTKNGISLKNINERLQLISYKNRDKELVLFSKLEGENNETIGHKIVLKIPLIYA